MFELIQNLRVYYIKKKKLQKDHRIVKQWYEWNWVLWKWMFKGSQCYYWKEMFTLYWTKCMSNKLPSIRFTASTSANSYTDVTGWAEWKKWTLPPSPTHCPPLTQSLHETVLSLPGLDHSSKEKDWQTALYIPHSDESHSV